MTLILWLVKEIAIRHLFKFFVHMCMMFNLLRLYENTKKKNTILGMMRGFNPYSSSWGLLYKEMEVFYSA